MSDYLFDKSGDDREVAQLEGLLDDFAHRAPLRALPDPPPAPRRSRARVAAAGALTLALAITLVVIIRRPSDACARGAAGFAFAVDGGPARCADGSSARGTLPVGEWLETSPGATAAVQIAEIGNLTMYGDTKLRLVDTGPGGHRMELARGAVSARVVAPPRLFVIDTPVATAFDLGCAYELAVGDDGHTRLRVTSGVVSLEGRGIASYVPMNSEVIAVPGRGPGTPVAVGAPSPLRAAVLAFDAGDPSALAAIVGAAEARDTVTLWNLLSRTTGAARAQVAARLDQLSPRPADVRGEDVIAGDATAIERWRDHLAHHWLCPGCP